MPAWRPLHMECRVCSARMGRINLLGAIIQFGLCSNRSCQTRRPLRDIICGPPHFSLPNPCGQEGCGCDGRPWWWPDRSPHLDEP